MGFSAGAAFSFEAFDRVFDGVAGSGGATETSAGGAEREVPQPIAPRFARMIIGGRQHGALCVCSPLGALHCAPFAQNAQSTAPFYTERTRLEHTSGQYILE